MDEGEIDWICLLILICLGLSYLIKYNISETSDDFLAKRRQSQCLENWNASLREEQKNQKAFWKDSFPDRARDPLKDKGRWMQI